MNDEHDVLSALLDGEPFDPEALVAALADPVGRELLIDLAVLRRIVQPSAIALARPPSSAASKEGSVSAPWSSLRWAAAAAAVIVALTGGYFAGTSREVVTTTKAPAPARVVHATVVSASESGGPR